MNWNLVGVAEIALLLGVTRQRADQLTKRDPMFPRPAAELAGGRVWNADAVTTWAHFRDRQLVVPGTLPSTGALRAVQGVVEAARDLLQGPIDSEAHVALRIALDNLNAALTS